MENQNQKESQESQHPNNEALIITEWTTIKQLEKMLADPELTIKEKTGVANVLAFHVNTLNRLLAQKGLPEELSEQSLGDYVRSVEPRIARHFRRDLRLWKRALSSRR